MTRNEAKKIIEQVVDRYGVAHALNIFAEVCGEKAEYLRSNWQDETSAKNWDKRMMLIDKLVNKLEK